jgi:hypothetical protein
LAGVHPDLTGRAMERRGLLFRAVVEIDRFLNHCTGGTYPETLSCRWERKREQGCKVCNFLCRVLHVFDKGHCERSKAHYDARRKLDIH